MKKNKIIRTLIVLFVVIFLLGVIILTSKLLKNEPVKNIGEERTQSQVLLDQESKKSNISLLDTFYNEDFDFEENRIYLVGYKFYQEIGSDTVDELNSLRDYVPFYVVPVFYSTFENSVNNYHYTVIYLNGFEEEQFSENIIEELPSKEFWIDNDNKIGHFYLESWNSEWQNKTIKFELSSVSDYEGENIEMIVDVDIDTPQFKISSFYITNKDGNDLLDTDEMQDLYYNIEIENVGIVEYNSKVNYYVTINGFSKFEISEDDMSDGHLLISNSICSVTGCLSDIDSLAIELQINVFRDYISDFYLSQNKYAERYYANNLVTSYLLKGEYVELTIPFTGEVNFDDEQFSAFYVGKNYRFSIAGISNKSSKDVENVKYELYADSGFSLGEVIIKSGVIPLIRQGEFYTGPETDIDLELPSIKGNYYYRIKYIDHEGYEITKESFISSVTPITEGTSIISVSNIQGESVFSFNPYTDSSVVDYAVVEWNDYSNLNACSIMQAIIPNYGCGANSIPSQPIYYMVKGLYSFDFYTTSQTISYPFEIQFEVVVTLDGEKIYELPSNYSRSEELGLSTGMGYLEANKNYKLHLAFPIEEVGTYLITVKAKYVGEDDSLVSNEVESTYTVTVVD